jgi:hypothetical protein
VRRDDYPHTVNNNSVVIRQHGKRNLVFGIYTTDWNHWSTSVNLEGIGGFDAGQWHHLAVVWDDQAPLEDSLRIYINGTRRSGTVSTNAPDRPVEVPVGVQPIQVGSLAHGRYPARTAIDDLRISRSVRYTGDFTPPATASSDADTSLLVEFDSDLSGQGNDPQGSSYTFAGAAGVADYD